MIKDKTHVIVLMSGGMDSVVTAAMANEKYEHMSFLHLNYGQKTHRKELECFQKISLHYKIPENRQKIINMDFLNQIGGSSLTDQKIEVSNYEGDNSNIPTSYVPFRNTHILSLAVSWAEIINAQKIFIGANVEDSPGYPDCRPAYYQAFNELIRQGTKDGKIKVETPVIYMKKSEIVQMGVKLNAPLELTWSCYAREDIACGVCDSCALRLRGFHEANINDPIDYIKEKK